MILGDQLRLDPMHSRKNERRSERVLRGGGALSGERRSRQRLQTAAQIGKHLVGHAGADAAGIDEPAVVGVVAEQEGAEMGPCSLRIGPADDNEFLAVEAFGFAPQAPVSGRIGRIDRLGNDALESKLAGMPADEFSVACLMVVELKPGMPATSGCRSALRSMSGRPAVSWPSRCRRSKA